LIQTRAGKVPKNVTRGHNCLCCRLMEWVGR